MSQPESQSSESVHNAQERKKSNLAFAFFCMEKDRAKDMEIFYAFCRLMDDIADDENRPAQERRNELLSWKNEIKKLYEGEKNLTPLAEEMRSMIERRNIPQNYVQDIIDGVLTDTYEPEFENFEQIRKYCYGVASAVGLVSIYIFGFKNERTKLFAEALGYALQFTNILRDVASDATKLNRVYIPKSELDAFGVSRTDLRDPSRNPNCKKLFAFQYFRAKHFFNKARRLIAEEDRKALTPAFIMWAIYERILEKLKASNFNITPTIVKISKPQKIRLALKAISDAKKMHLQNDFFGKATVVGAGIAGITAATRLALKGFDVEVFEARNSLGGRISKIEHFGIELDNACHATMGCYQNFFQSIKMLGNNPNKYFSAVAGMDFIGNGKKISINYPRSNSIILQMFSYLSYAKIKEFSTFKNLKLLLGIKFGFTTANANETAVEFLKRKGISQETINVFWSPFCVSALNTSVENADALLMIKTLKKSILKGFENGILHLPTQPMVNAFEIFKTYIEGVGGKISFSDSVKQINFEGNNVKSIETSKSGKVDVKYLFSAIPAKTLERLLPENSSTKQKLQKIKNADIVNIYFTTSKKIIENDYACLINSPLHWIFNHSQKLKSNSEKFLYSITISDFSLVQSKEKTKEFLQTELSKIFGNVQIDELLPASFAGATISADVESENARPTQIEVLKEFNNLYALGDWVQTDLPCTMESSAKSAFDFWL